MDDGRKQLPDLPNSLRAQGWQDPPTSVRYSSTLTSGILSHGIDIARTPAIYSGIYSTFDYLDKQEILATPMRKKFFPRASRGVLKALLQTPPMRIYSPDPSCVPCPTGLRRAIDSSICVLETSSLTKQHGLDEWQSSRAPTPASLLNVTPLPLRLTLLPSSSVVNGFDVDLASSDSFALSLPTSDAGSSPAVHMRMHTQSARALRSNSDSESHSDSKSDPFVASRRSSCSHACLTGSLVLPTHFTELLCPTVAASAASTRPAEREGPPSPSSEHMRLSHPLPAYDPRRVMGSGVSVGTVERYQRVIQELQRQGFGDDHWDNRRRRNSAPEDEGDGDEDDGIINTDVEPPSPSPKPWHGHLPYSDTELELKLDLGLKREREPLDMARGSPFSGSVAPYSYSYSHSQLAASVSDSDLSVAELELEALGLGHGHGRGSFRLPATASAPLLCSLGPDLWSEDGYGAHPYTPRITEDVTRRTSTPPANVGFWQPRFSLHVTGDDSSSSCSSSGSAAGDPASGVCASDGSCLRSSSTFAAMRRDFVALLSGQADEEEAQAMQLRAIANGLEKRARSKRLLVDAIE